MANNDQFQINCNLPSQYGYLNIIKAISFPYSKSFSRLLVVLDQVQSQSQLPFYLLCGTIEGQIGTTFQPCPDSQKVNIRYLESQPQAVHFLQFNQKQEHEPISHLIRRIAQLCLCISGNGYPSFDSITAAIINLHLGVAANNRPQIVTTFASEQTKDVIVHTKHNNAPKTCHNNKQITRQTKLASTSIIDVQSKQGQNQRQSQDREQSQDQIQDQIQEQRQGQRQSQDQDQIQSQDQDQGQGQGHVQSQNQSQDQGQTSQANPIVYDQHQGSITSGVKRVKASSSTTPTSTVQAQLAKTQTIIQKLNRKQEQVHAQLKQNNKQLNELIGQKAETNSLLNDFL